MRAGEMAKLERNIAAERLARWVRSRPYQLVRRSRRAACMLVQAYARRRLARREARERRAAQEAARVRRVSVLAARTMEDISSAARVIQLHCRQARRTLAFKVARHTPPASPLDLHHISPISPPHLPYISAASRPPGGAV